MPGNYRPGEAADSLRRMTREALLATAALRGLEAGAAGRSVQDLGRSAAAAARSADRFAGTAGQVARAADAIAEAALGVKGLRADLGGAAKLANEAAKGAAVAAAAARLKVATAPAGLGAGMAAANLAAPKAADLAVKVSTSGLKSGFSAAAAVVKAGIAGLVRVAVLPISLSMVALKVGFTLAKAYLLYKVKELSGLSTIQFTALYFGLKVQLAIAKRLVTAAVRGMAAVATFPIKVTLNVMRAALRTAVGLAKAAGRQIGAALAAPARAAALAGSIGLAGVGLGGLVGVPAVVGGAVKAASDLEETVSKVRFTFNDAAGVVLKGADDMAARFGVVRETSLAAAAGIGNIGKASGLTDAKSAQLGVQMTKLAGDLASFHNIGFDDALEKIRAGLVGEAEPLRTLGVLLSEDAVKSKALALGLAQAGKAGGLLKGSLDESDKVMARVAIIMEQTKTAQGDLARTADSLANRLRELWGRAQNLAASLGSYLLPAAKALSAVLADMAKDTAARLEAAKGTLAGWAEGLKNAAEYAGVVYRNFGEFRKVAGLVAKDLGRNVWEGLRVAFLNGVSYAKYFGQVLEERIAAGIENGIGRGLKPLRGLGLLAGLPGGGVAAGLDVFGAGPRKPAEVRAPELVRPDFRFDAGIKEALRDVAAAEKLRKVFDAVRGAAGTASGVLGAFADASRKSLGLVGERDRRSALALERQTRAVARAALAQRDWSNLPKGFQTPAQRRARLTPAKALAALPALNAGLAGGLAGLAGGGPAAVVAAVAGSAAKSAVEKPALAATAERGSREAYTAIARFSAGGGDPIKSVAKTAKDQLTEQRKTNQYLAAIRTGSGTGRLSAFTF